MLARRRTATLAALATTGLAGLVTGLPGGASAATDDTPGYSLHHVSVTVEVGPAGDPTCQVDADLYQPDTASSTHKVPSILTTNGFGGSKDDDNTSATGRAFVTAGYAVLAYTGLGFPDSGCKITLDDPDYDGRAGKQLVDVLAGTRAYTEDGTTKKLRIVSQERPGDPRVGMIGGSYGGQVQYAVAAQDPRVDALIPIITWNDLSYSLAPNNTDLAHGVTYTTPGVAKKEWTSLFFGEGIVDGVQGASVDPGRVGPPCPNFADQACPSIAQLLTLGYPSAGTLTLARHASVSTYVSKVKAPTLVVQGQKDTLFNLQEATATYRALKAQGTPTRMIWQSWGHSSSTPAPGELDFDAASLRSSYLGNRFLNWMDHYVRGTSAPVGPAFSYFRDWVPYDTSAAKAGTAIKAAYAERSSFSDTPTASLYLTGGNGLTPTKSKVTTGSQSYANASGAPTSYSETSGLEGNQVNLPATDTPGTYAQWTSPTLANGVSLVGSSRLTLHLDAPTAARTQLLGPAGQLVLFAKIYDVAPDGTQTLHDRLISPARVGDVTKPVTVRLPAVVQRFPAGHRIRVVVAASDAAYAGNALVQPVTVRTSRTAPSVLKLPLTSTPAFR